MKTNLRSVLAVLIPAALFAASDVCAAPSEGGFTYHGIEWTFEEGGYIGYSHSNYVTPAVPTNTKGDIVVPAEYEEEIFWCISAGAFAGCSLLTSIAFPATIERVETGVFDGCTALERVLLPDRFEGVDIGLPAGVEAEYYDPSGVVIASSALPEAMEETAFTVWLEAVGGTMPYAWSAVGEDDGGAEDPGYVLTGLPDGVSLASDGTLSGTASEPGDYSFLAVVEDADGLVASRLFVLTITEDPALRPAIESTTPSVGFVEDDGLSSIVFSVSATHPDSGTLAYEWTVDGEPVGTDPTFEFAGDADAAHEIVCIVSGDGLAKTASVRWTTRIPLRIATDAALPVALTEISYYLPLEAAGGEEPYTWEIVDEGDWPACFWTEDLAGYGALYGWPYEDDIGTYSFALRVTDAEGTSVERTFTLEVQENPDPPPVIDARSPDVYHLRIDPGQSQTFSVEAHDPRGDALTYQWEWCDEADWEYSVAGTEATFSFSSETEGVYEIRCSVSDGANEATESWEVKVGYPKTVYIDQASTAADPDGTSWETAYPTLGDAQGDIETGDIVLVAPGAYSCPYLPGGIELRSRDGAAVTSFDDGIPAYDALTVVGFTFEGVRFTDPSPRPGDPVVPSGSTLVGCVVSDCSSEGDLLDGCMLENCVVKDNRSGDWNYVLRNCDLENCVVFGNRSGWSVVSGCSMRNCTLTRNTAEQGDPIVDNNCSAWNSILWDNPDRWGEDWTFGPSYWDGELYSAALTNCCVPNLARSAAWLAEEGYSLDLAVHGCFEADPKLVDPANGDVRLRAGSPCIDAGANEWVRGDTDAAGNPRVQGDAVDLGALEGAVDGFVLSVRIVGAGTVSPMTAVVPAGGSATFEADESGGRPFQGWTIGGADAGSATTYTWSAVQADGELVATFGAFAFRVDAATGDDANDGLSWENAMATIQAAVDAAADGESVLVKPGVYDPIDTSGKAIQIESTDGAAETVIDGGGMNRCAFLGNGEGLGSTLAGFTLRNGNASEDVIPKAGMGGGAYGGTLLDCDVAGCRAGEEGGGLAYVEAHRCRIVGNGILDGDGWAYGGGAADSSLYSCLVVSNAVSLVLGTQDTSATALGGGAAWCSLYQCTVADNIVEIVGDTTGVDVNVGAGGMLYGSVAGNIVYGNTANGEPSNVEDWDGSLDAPGSLVGVDPLFVDRANGDYRLRAGSPAVDVGATDVEAWRDPATTDTDLDGNPRVRGNSIDLGCYESAWSAERTETVTTPDPVPYAWLDEYRLAGEEGYELAAAAMASNEVDAVWQCYVAGLVPTNANARFEANISFDSNGDPVVTWTPDLGEARSYTVEGKAALGDDWGETDDDSRFFRVKVKLR